MVPTRGTRVHHNMLTGKMELDEFYEAGESRAGGIRCSEGQSPLWCFVGASCVTKPAVICSRLSPFQCVFCLLVVGVFVTGLQSSTFIRLCCLGTLEALVPLLLRELSALINRVVVVALSWRDCFFVGGINGGESRRLPAPCGRALTCGPRSLVRQAFKLMGPSGICRDCYTGYYELNSDGHFHARCYRSPAPYGLGWTLFCHHDVSYTQASGNCGVFVLNTCIGSARSDGKWWGSHDDHLSGLLPGSHVSHVLCLHVPRGFVLANIQHLRLWSAEVMTSWLGRLRVGRGWSLSLPWWPGCFTDLANGRKTREWMPRRTRRLSCDSPASRYVLNVRFKVPGVRHSGRFLRAGRPRSRELVQ
jgi:hypothetical protein